jgi:hypothetical protein
MTGVGWYSQQISLNFLNLVKFYICKPKSTGRGSLIKKQTIRKEAFTRGVVGAIFVIYTSGRRKMYLQIEVIFKH